MYSHAECHVSSKGQQSELQPLLLPVKNASEHCVVEKSSAVKTDQCRSVAWWSLIFKELKAKANKHLTNRRVRWQNNKKEQTLWPLPMKIRPGKKRERDPRETTQTTRGVTKIYCVHPDSITETNIIEVNWWPTVWTLPVTAVTLNQRDLPGFSPPVSVKAPDLTTHWENQRIMEVRTATSLLWWPDRGWN